MKKVNRRNLKIDEDLRGIFMLKILCLILILMCSTAFAQTKETKESYKFFEYEKISSGLLEEKIISLCKESGKTSWIGWIINYGTPKEISDREKIVKKNYSEVFTNSPCHHDSRIMFLRVEDKEKSKTEFWVVPPGEEPPPTKK